MTEGVNVVDALDAGETIRIAEDDEHPFADARYFEHIKKINEVFYDQIKISDQKAAYIFTFMLAFLISSSEGRGVFTLGHYREAALLTVFASGALAVASVFSIICAIFVILPRRSAKTTTMFWGAWEQKRAVFTQAALKGDLGYLFREYLDNADVLAGIARDKYRFVTLAFRGLVVTVLSYVILLMVG
ncbi:Pycsar system effector family protein [Rhizobium rhizosphaerae]|uniref:Pycsar system effector family protein n=1 Tax=Xaviernesmea rhizosphaerae TaxID=1672749 RepID=UPI001FDA6712|nr:Pycsar system effector family protein [Xaviernesmea rhizosphaerae]